MNPAALYKKYRSFSAEARASFWYMICSLFQKGISFIVVPIYTRILTKSEFGQYNTFISWKNIFVIIATLNLSAGIFTRGLVNYKDRRDEYTSEMQGLSSIVSMVIFLVFIFLYQPINYWTHFDLMLLCALFAFYLFNPAYLFWSVRQRVENKYVSMVLVTSVVSILVPVLSIVLYYTTDLKAHALMYGFLIAQTLVGVFFYFLHLKKSRRFFSKSIWVESLKFNIPLIPHYLSLIILQQSDRLMIERLCSSSDVALYSLTYNVAQIIIIFISSINGSLVPWMYKRLKDKDYQPMHSITNTLTVALGVMSVFIMVIAPEVVLFMGGKDYAVAMWCIPPVVMGTFYTFCYGLFSTVEFHFGNTKYVAVASVTGAIANVVLNYIFIPIYGYVAASYTTEFCYLLLTIMHFFFMKKMSKDPIFADKKLWGICIGLTILSILFTLTYYNNIVRYLLGVVIVIVIAVNFKKVKGILASLKK